MKLQLVSFPLAKLLKEVGFDELCEYYYVHKFGNSKYLEKEHGKLKEVTTNDIDNGTVYHYKRKNCVGQPHIIIAPTLELAKMWFREECGIDISVSFSAMDKLWFAFLFNRKTMTGHRALVGELIQKNTYEAALEDGLIKACELIKTK